MEKIKILELFSGYGGASFALTKAGIKHECIGYSDIEKCANYIYALNHGEDIPALGNVKEINENELPDFDLLTGGFPCQSFSMAGKREGFKAKDKGQLFFDIIRIAKEKKPRRMLLENVQGILSHDGGNTMQIVLNELRSIGYYVNWKLLFSKEHGTPQNRPRVWFACFRDKEDYDQFMFPEKEPLKITVKDLLEDEVDETYYLSEKQLKRLQKTTYGNMIEQDLNKPFRTITSHMEKDKLDVPYFKIADFRYDEGLRPRKDGNCPTLSATQKSGNGLSGMPIIFNPFNKYTSGTICDTIGTSVGGCTGKTTQLTNTNARWRRLTPRECFRLMGFFNDEIKFGDLSDSKLYFLAGNGWDINTASKIFTQMFKGNTNKQKNINEWFK